MKALTRLFNRLAKHFTGACPLPEDLDADRLRLEFRRRYHWFRRLLRANRAALDDMADLQALAHSAEPFALVRIRTISAHVSLEVWKIVDSMVRLAPGRYDVLTERFAAIRDELDELLAHGKHGRHATQGPLVRDMASLGLADTPQVGGKMAVLGEIRNRMGLVTPNGFVVTAAAFRRFMDHNELEDDLDSLRRTADAGRLDALHALSSALQERIASSPLPPDLEKALDRAAAAFPGPFAVRSSALAEDTSGNSFAGLHRSTLNVAKEHLGQAYKEVVASLYSLQAKTYRLQRGIPDADAVMCVGVLEMVPARSGGVLYTADPLGGPGDQITINGVWGLPKAVVDGRCAGDVFRISPDGGRVESMESGKQECVYTPMPVAGVGRRPLREDQEGSLCLSEDEALELARLALALQERLGAPLDVEWVVTPDGDPVILQARPLHVAASVVDQAAGAEAGPDSDSDTDAVADTVADTDAGQDDAHAPETIPGATPETAPDADQEPPDAPTPAPLLTGGVAASPGAAGGVVKVVRRTIDTLDLPQGSVLVTAQALPRLAAVLDRVAAVVAETGSLTGHLANVCREFGVPALFGVQGAIQALQDGQEVTVDAEGGRVLPGLGHVPVRPRQAWADKDTPVRRILDEVSARITPLKLVDPASPHFRADRVATYHDITRYCHEKAVDEMFRFGRDHHFPERSSKRLFTHTATRWWVLNLDDGFTPEAETAAGADRFVRLEHIACKPMLALWRGVAAKPWEGPPPLDAGGFLSVMFRSTTDRSLAVGAKPKQHERNYFMISRDYCSLTSRLGYHFCTVETLVTGRATENYAKFQFQGGAADDVRRARRVALIAAILEDHGFTAEVRGDHLRATLQDLEDETMHRRLTMLGYLSIHTRQLDMALSKPGDTARFDALLRRGIDEVAPA